MKTAEQKYIRALQIELLDLAYKVECAGMGGHFENYKKAVKRARKLARPPATLEFEGEKFPLGSIR